MYYCKLGTYYDIVLNFPLCAACTYMLSFIYYAYYNRKEVMSLAIILSNNFF